MDLTSFKNTLAQNTVPQNMSVYLKAMWHDAKGDWKNAHKLVQELNDKNAALIHAYLHRKQGDVTNADYWYRLAGKKRPPVSVEKEWEEIILMLL